MNYKLKDRVAVITGGGGGIGAEICREFARQGARIAVTDIKIEKARSVAEEIVNTGGLARAWSFDVVQKNTVEKVAEEIEKELGPISIWINNAGISRIVPFLECTEETWDLIQRINLKGCFVCCQIAIGRMLSRKKGVIINMSSQSGKVGNSQYAAYCASKFGIIGLTQSLAIEFAGKGIRVNAICPGVVWTPLWDGMMDDYAKKKNIKPEEVKTYFESKIPLGRLCTAEDVAKLAVFLASDEANYITGQAINVSGGTIMD